MVESENKARPLIGMPSYDNWRAFIEGEPPLEEYEYLIYTDAKLTGQPENPIGPYTFFNLLPYSYEPGPARAAIAFRLSLHVVFDTPMQRTDQSRYHGGSLVDEIAALASLKCGVRLRAGGATRRFAIGGDPKGKPVSWSTRAEPSFYNGTQGVVLPTVSGEHSIMPMEEMMSFPSLRPEQAIALVRSARLYQDALWFSESEANLSWLLLVAAIETAANLWRAGNDTPLDRLKESHSDFVEYLESTRVPELSQRIATEFVDSIGATRKFVDFLLAYLAPPPSQRPGTWGQVEWTGGNLRSAFRKIYSHRSKALHEGMPFPFPMCQPQERFEQW